MMRAQPAYCCMKDSATASISKHHFNSAKIRGPQRNGFSYTNKHSTVRPYKYESLETPTLIRLLSIHPSADPLAPISGSLNHVDLKKEPLYEALSYTWGPSADSKTIRCGANGEILSITQNCASALRRIRWPDKERVFWIDAICVNQHDTAERNAQVAVMGMIYSGAFHVLIDVGEASRDSDLALDTISDPEGWGALSPTLKVSEVFDKSVYAILRFWNRPWFHRVWVLQEVFRARKASVFGGRRLTSWDTHCTFHDCILGSPRDGLKNLIPGVCIFRSNSNVKFYANQRLLILLEPSRSCVATLSQDRMFELLPMLEDAEEAGLKAQYSKNAGAV